jgi:hypothetical protein
LVSMCNNFFLHNDKSSILFVNNHLDIQVNFFFLHNLIFVQYELWHLRQINIISIYRWSFNNACISKWLLTNKFELSWLCKKKKLTCISKWLLTNKIELLSLHVIFTITPQIVCRNKLHVCVVGTTCTFHGYEDTGICN